MPYKGEGGILGPLLSTLHECGVRKENVTLLVGTGTHRPSTAEEKMAILGAEVARQYRVVDHACDDEAMLVGIGTTKSGTGDGSSRRTSENHRYSAVFSRKEHQLVPGGAGWDYLPDGEILGPLEATRAMVQHAVISAAHHPRWAGRLPSMAFIPEGPYAVPTTGSAPDV